MFEAGKLPYFKRNWIYSLFKDFASPIAVIFASCVAAFFAYRQWKTAESQAKTSLDKLRFDLFDKRYAIYDHVKQLLKLLINDTRKPDFDQFAVTQHLVVIDEAVFFFTQETCDWLESVKADCQRYREMEASSRELAADYKPRDSANLQLRLSGYFQEMPKRFETEFRFHQLKVSARRVWFDFR